MMATVPQPLPDKSRASFPRREAMPSLKGLAFGTFGTLNHALKAVAAEPFPLPCHHKPQRWRDDLMISIAINLI